MATSKIPLLGAIRQVQLTAAVDPDTGYARTSDNPAPVSSSIKLADGGTCMRLTLALGVQQQTAVIGAATASVHCNADCYARRGASPVAQRDGTDQFFPANTLARLVGLDATDKLSFVAAAGLGAVVHITPGA